MDDHRFDPLGQLPEDPQSGLRVGYPYDEVGSRIQRQTGAEKTLVFDYDPSHKIIIRASGGVGDERARNIHPSSKLGLETSLEFIRKVADFLDEPGNEIYKGRGSSKDEIEGAQNELGVIFDPDYINFVQAFGGSFVGVAIYGFNNSKMLESSSVVDLTDRFRRDGWPGAEGAYVISMDMSGNPVMIDASGSVFTYDHDSGDTRSMAASFRDFVEAAL